jgi:hypothetical protein
VARATAADTFAAACGDFADLKKSLSADAPLRAVERAAMTHALWCQVCRPLADRVRAAQAARVEQLAAEARAEHARAAADALDAAARVIEVNGFFRHYLWDTRQAGRGTPIESCRVDIVGAIAVALYGSPTYAGAPRVRGVEEFLTEVIDAPSVAAWCSYPGHGRRQALDVLRDAADVLRSMPRCA